MGENMIEQRIAQLELSEHKLLDIIDDGNSTV